MAPGDDRNPDLVGMGAQQAAESLQASLDKGLRGEEAAERLARYGHNEVPQKRRNPLLLFLSKFWGPTAWMLELIIVLSWILQRRSDVYIVSSLLAVNSVLSFAQEHRASQAVEILKKQLQIVARVLRDGTWGVVPARELVPGDVIRARPGDFVPADAKIVEGELEIDQSALTGESQGIEKKADDVLYSGSIVRRGEANALVILTGARTYYGRTAELVQIARPKLHIEEVTSQVVRWLFLIVSVLVAAAFILSAARGVPIADILPLALVLLLSAIPVALPVMFTVSMAVGSLQLAHKGVLVTRLSAAEDAATMDVLCADKTGTITMNRLAVADVLPMLGWDEKDVLRYGALASREANQDPLDLAFLGAAKERGLIDGTFAITRFLPFDPETRRTEAVVEKSGENFRVMKGAVRSVAQASGADDKTIDGLEEKATVYAQKGHRVLAVAFGKEGERQQLVGLVSLFDALRPDSKRLIRELRGLGISVKMLTGDALPIARDVAVQAGFGNEIRRISDLSDLSQADAARAAELAERSDGFAEVYPEGKFTIVKSLQARGHVVGMTGDGVNDSPALRQAEVGIAVASATDVAKGASSVVLTGDGLGDIVSLIENGRMIYQRITTWIVNKVSRTILKAGFVVLAYLLTGRYVISASGMILVVLMTDFGKIALSTDNVRWSRDPETWNVRSLVKVGLVLGLVMLLECVGLLFLGLKVFDLESNLALLQTFTFEMLLFFALFSLLAVRERRHFWRSMPSRTLLLALLLEGIVGATLGTVGVPGLSRIPFVMTLSVIGYSFLFSLVVNDWIKFELVKRFHVRY